MNKKQLHLDAILDAVISCCNSTICNDATKDDVLGDSRKENAVMTRSILARTIKDAGYSTTTIAAFLNKSAAAVRHLYEICDSYKATSKAFRIALDEAREMCKSL